MQRQNFAIDHDINRIIEVESDSLHSLPFSERMLDVCPVIEPREITNQSEPADRPPSDIFHQAIVDLSLGRDHHRAAGELAVVESNEQAAPIVEVVLPLDSCRERTPIESRKRQEDRCDVSKLSPRTEAAFAKCSDIG